MEPTPDGHVTGLLFKGRGRFRMAIPDLEVFLPKDRADGGNGSSSNLAR